MQLGAIRTCPAQDATCVVPHVYWLDWEGNLLARADLPTSEGAVGWFTWAPAPDGTLYMLGADTSGKRHLGTYLRGETAAAAVTPVEGEPNALVTLPEGVKVVDRIYRPGTIDRHRLDGRTGTQLPIELDGNRQIRISVEEGVVFALVKLPGDRDPSTVVRILELVPGQEQLLRELAEGPDGRLILAMEGSAEAVELLISRDGGLSWIGARGGW